MRIKPRSHSRREAFEGGFLVGFLIALAVSLVVAFSIAVTRNARAHGDAAWIQADPTYVTAMGSHCCGPADCERVPEGEVVETEPGRWLVRSTNQTFTQTERGVYPAIRPGFWWCRRGERVVCLFYDGGAS